jgi:hypothetical protein
MEGQKGQNAVLTMKSRNPFWLARGVSCRKRQWILPEPEKKRRRIPRSALFLVLAGCIPLFSVPFVPRNRADLADCRYEIQPVSYHSIGRPLSPGVQTIARQSQALPSRWGWIYGLTENQNIPILVEVVSFSDPQPTGKLILVCHKSERLEAAAKNSIQGRKHPDLLFILSEAGNGRRVEYKLWNSRILSRRTLGYRSAGKKIEALEIVFFSNAIEKSGAGSKADVIGLPFKE